MTTTMARVAAAHTSVALTSHRYHPHKPSPIKPGFVPPSPARAVRFSPLALAASVARATTLLPAPEAMLLRRRNSALSDIQDLIWPRSPFELTPWIKLLADSTRTGFAASVGAGMTDLFMNEMGYVWRDNAVILASVLDPHSDFIYGGGSASGHGVVLAEAFGSFAANVTAGRIERKARQKYLRQVKPHLGKKSIHGQVVHGYSVAFGSRPDSPGAFLSVSETRVAPQLGPSGSSSPDDLETPSPAATSLVLSAHHSNFLLMGATPVSGWINWVRRRGARPQRTDGILFRREWLGGSPFLRVVGRGESFDDPPVQHAIALARAGYELAVEAEVSDAPAFVLQEGAADAFLPELSQRIAAEVPELPAQMTLPTFRPVGLFSRGDDRPVEAPPFAVFSDGLGIRGPDMPKKTLEFRIWHPKEGLGPVKYFD